MQRFITVPYGTDGETALYSRFEVLEAFNGNGKERQFNLRRKGGLGGCEGAEIVRELEKTFNIENMVAEVHPLAGDICVIFKEKVDAPKSVPAGDAGRSDSLHVDAPATVRGGTRPAGRVQGNAAKGPAKRDDGAH